jgi:hypothetical protein
MLRRDSGRNTDMVILDKKQINPFDRGTLVRIIIPVVEMDGKTKNHEIKSKYRQKVLQWS